MAQLRIKFQPIHELEQLLETSLAVPLAIECDWVQHERSGMVSVCSRNGKLIRSYRCRDIEWMEFVE